MLRIFSVNCPPSSNPTYPGGEPTKRLTACFSMYSDISIRTRASWSPNIASANVFANSVFPTPVGPRNKNEPIGRFGSFNPLRARRIERATADTASSCPITRWCNSFSKWTRRSLSFFSICFNGIPVHCDTTSAISSSVIAATNSRLASTSTFWRSFSSLSRLACSFLRKRAASSNFCSRIASSFFCASSSTSASSF